MEVRAERARELGLTSEDIDWFNYFAHPEKWGDACVLWDGAFWWEYQDTPATHRHGYFVWGPDEDPKGMPASRLAYELYRGDIGEGLYGLHKCPGKTNKNLGRCVNAFHIQPGTQEENIMDRYKDLGLWACFEERHTLSPASRMRKYKIGRGLLNKLDAGEHALTRGKVKEIDV